MLEAQYLFFELPNNDPTNKLVFLITYINSISCHLFQRNTLASGVIPQISLIMGPCAGMYS